MKTAKLRSRMLLVGAILSAALLAACGGSDPSGNSTDPPSTSSSLQGSSSAQISSSSSSTSSTNDSTFNTSSDADANNAPADSTNSTLPTQNTQLRAVTLSWQPPTTNTDGTVLTDLRGYVIRYGVQAQEYTNSITITNPGITTYVIDNLPAGTYYFSIIATAENGAESAPSPQVIATVD